MILQMGDIYRVKNASRDRIRHKGIKFPSVYYLLSILVVIVVLLHKYGITIVSIKLEIVIPIVVASCIFIVVGYYLIKAYKKESRKKKYLNSPLSKIDKMTGKEFENYLQAYFEDKGYRVELTPVSNDYGADLVLYYRDEKTVVQAKRYKNKVGIEAIQQIISAREYYKADNAIVATNSFFTPNATRLAQNCDVELWDRNRLFEIK